VMTTAEGSGRPLAGSGTGSGPERHNVISEQISSLVPAFHAWVFQAFHAWVFPNPATRGRTAPMDCGSGSSPACSTCACRTVSDDAGSIPSRCRPAALSAKPGFVGSDGPIGAARSQRWARNGWDQRTEEHDRSNVCMP
jgi:hypothetical protein